MAYYPKAKKMEFDVFSITTWPLLTTSSADTLSEVPSRHTWMVVKVSKLVARFRPNAVLHLSHSSQSFPTRCKSIFAISPLEALHGFSFSLRAKAMVLTMAKGSARLVPSHLSAHFLSPCHCSNHTVFPVILWLLEELSALVIFALAISSTWNAWLNRSASPGSLLKWPLIREAFCDPSP